jgi:hypothetical protein
VHLFCCSVPGNAAEYTASPSYIGANPFPRGFKEHGFQLRVCRGDWAKTVNDLKVGSFEGNGEPYHRKVELPLTFPVSDDRPPG